MKRKSFVILALMGIFIGFVLNNILKPYLIDHGLKDFHLVDVGNGFFFMASAYSITNAFHYKEMSWKQLISFTAVSILFFIPFKNIPAIIGAVLGWVTICTFSMYVIKRKKVE
ncbi:hypothetical protein [Bacteroides graminisolvens]|uniref:hypothetical protein n=1 Tax=Bacteroides graminisolvens TaxID=477666 RepID=UPI0029C97198|nr:hypothetical protein [Bacteroides graminisolvens]